MKKTAGLSLPKSILSCGAAAVLLGVILSAAASALIIREIVGEKFISTISAAIQASAVFAGAFLAVNQQNNRRLIAALGAAAVYFVICVLCKLAFFPGETTLMFRNAVIAVASALLAVAIRSVKRKKRSPAYRRRGK